MKRYRLNVKQFAKSVTILVLIIALFVITIDVIRFPEWYMSTWRYQLKNDIENGEETAIEYYENTYIANGRILFD